MIVPIRKTIAGTEYWDTEKKQSLFVPKGSEPDFEVTENPKSMITPEGDKEDISNAAKLFIKGAEVKAGGNPEINNAADHIHAGTIKQEVLDSGGNTKDDFDGEPVTNREDEEPSELDSKTAKELRAYAKKNNIEIPAAIRAKGDILEIIKESEK
ncbi:Rho termination factor N-terminal domain-containing protein [Enterococcus gallinarum]|uniref:Rho termination factor N-terminal domain-containing protein n=1 Tax=Enterococcus gallinarum TaxID=1353 RepID=UPI0032E40920